MEARKEKAQIVLKKIKEFNSPKRWEKTVKSHVKQKKTAEDTNQCKELLLKEYRSKFPCVAPIPHKQDGVTRL